MAPGAWAGSYEVKACDAAVGANNSWTLSATPGQSAQTLCPSNGDQQRGIATRIIATVPAGTYERATFYAPAGTTISGFRWAGRWARDSCSWATEIRARPNETTVVGNRENSQCALFSAGMPNPTYVPTPAGTTSLMQNVQCGAGSCPSGATMHTYYAAVVVQDPALPSLGINAGGLASPNWLRGVQHAAFSASDNIGISRVEPYVDGRGIGGLAWPCDFTRTVPCANRGGATPVPTVSLADGAHTLRLTAIDAAGNRRSVDRAFKTDNTAPGRVVPHVVGGDGWRRANGFAVRWSNPPQAYAPIVRARYRLCGPDGSCFEDMRDGSGIQQLSNLPAERLGDNTLQVWLEDEAGNQTKAVLSDPAHLRLDPEAPQLAFLSQDPSDPLTVAARATDGYSGVASGEIEMRLRGGRAWHGLDTRLERGRLVADIDDEHFADGTYDFRAHATDHAGNESSTATRTDGAHASIRLPVRVPTGLRVGFPKTKVKRRVVRRHGRRRVVRREVRVLAPSARLRFGHSAVLRGTLANPDGQPIDGATITVLAKTAQPGSDFATAGLVHTDVRGRFSYTARASSSRVLRFRYSGSRRIRGATRDVRMLVPAAGTIGASRTHLLNGEAVTFTGRVRTGPVPKAGKLVEVQAYFRGRWRTFSTTRTDRAGRWRFPYRFGATTGVVRYRFRAVLPREGGYPFAGGRTRVVTVVVRGL